MFTGALEVVELFFFCFFLERVDVMRAFSLV